MSENLEKNRLTSSKFTQFIQFVEQKWKVFSLNFFCATQENYCLRHQDRFEG
jgi:hypothetical protein